MTSLIQSANIATLVNVEYAFTSQPYFSSYKAPEDIPARFHVIDDELRRKNPLSPEQGPFTSFKNPAQNCRCDIKCASFGICVKQIKPLTAGIDILLRVKL